ELWAKIYHNKDIDPTYAYRILLDNEENVYTSGYTTNSLTIGRSLIEIKYNKNGAQIWVTIDTFAGKGVNNSVFFVGAEFDAQGNTVLLGSANDTLSIYHRELLVQVDPDGNIISSQLYHSGSPYDEVPYFLMKDSAQNIYTFGAGTD